MSETIIRLSGLTKKYENRAVVDHISLEIRKGEIFGLLGPNGAGKSTTMNMICSLVRATSGDIEVFGKNTKNEMNKIKKNLGYIPQELALHENLKAWENVELFTSLYGIRGKELKEAVSESLEFVGLEEKRNGYAKNFSGGMKRRLNIACAIGHKPELLIFDEPTTALDPETREMFYSLTGEMNQQEGTTVILVTHDIGVIGEYARNLLYLDKKVIFSGTFKEFCSSRDMAGIFGPSSQHIICHQHDRTGGTI